MSLRVFDLFSGIGGFSLGLERAGMTTVAFCEVDPFCRAVLAQHWPGVPIYDDVRQLTADTLRRDGITVDLICGGFPCQDISFAGRRAGLEGERSGLWIEYARLIRELRPRYVIVENVPGLLSLGMDRVLGDLAALGYDAVWDCMPAQAVGAPHRRDRVWIIAHSRSQQHEGRRAEIGRPAAAQFSAANANGNGQHDGSQHAEMGRTSEPVADAAKLSEREPTDQAHAVATSREARHELSDSGHAGYAHGARLAVRQGERGHSRSQFAPTIGTDWWIAEPDVGRVADGVPSRVDRLRSLGNAVVPQIPELIGRAIIKAEATA